MNTSLREPRVLGRTGLLVGRLGVAGARGVPAAALEHAFHEYGVNYFFHGTFRRRGMRDALRRLGRSHRDRIVIALASYDRAGRFVRRSVERGLRSIRADVLDVLVLGYHPGLPQQALVDATLRLRERGLVRFLGLSGHRRSVFGELARREDNPFDVFMVRYNAAHRGAEEEVFRHLPKENRPGVTTFTATRWGRLLKEKGMPPGERPLTPVECYRFALSHPAVDVCLTGPGPARELEENLAALDAGPLSKKDMERIRRIGDHVHASP